MRYLYNIMGLDEKDLKILEALKDNAKLSTYKIAKKTLIPVATVHNRVRKLEQQGVIRNYQVVVDHKKLGNIVTAYILAHYNLGAWETKISREAFKKKLLVLPHVEEVKYLTGQFDILLKGHFKDLDEVNNLLLDRLRKIPGIGKTQTFFVTEDVK